MKTIFFKFTLIVAIFVFNSCSKILEVNNIITPIISDYTDTTIAIVQDNMQFANGNYTSNYHAEAHLPSNYGVTNIQIAGMQVPLIQNGEFYCSNASNSLMAAMQNSIIGNSGTVAFNGVNIGSIVYPLTNQVNTNNYLPSWQISKSTGLTLSFSKVNNSNVAATQIISDGTSLISIVAISPSDLLSSKAVTKYWFVDNSNTVTISPTDLSSFAANEKLDITIGSGTNTLKTFAGKPVHVVSMNITHLPEITVN